MQPAWIVAKKCREKPLLFCKGELQKYSRFLRYVKSMPSGLWYLHACLTGWKMWFCFYSQRYVSWQHVWTLLSCERELRKHRCVLCYGEPLSAEFRDLYCIIRILWVPTTFQWLICKQIHVKYISCVNRILLFRELSIGRASWFTRHLQYPHIPYSRNIMLDEILFPSKCLSFGQQHTAGIQLSNRRERWTIP